MTTYTLLLGTMTPPTPGASPQSRLFGQATPPDGAGPIGPDQYWPQPLHVSFDALLGLFGLGPDRANGTGGGQAAGSPGPAGQTGTGQTETGQTGTGHSAAGQNVPAGGTSRPRSIDDILPPAVRMISAIVFATATGNPATAFATILPLFAANILALGPDTSGPAVRPGFQLCGSQAGYEPVSPGPGEGSLPSAVMMMSEWQSRQYLEKGIMT